MAESASERARPEVRRFQLSTNQQEVEERCEGEKQQDLKTMHAPTARAAAYELRWRRKCSSRAVLLKQLEKRGQKRVGVKRPCNRLRKVLGTVKKPDSVVVGPVSWVIRPRFNYLWLGSELGRQDRSTALLDRPDRPQERASVH